MVSYRKVSKVTAFVTFEFGVLRLFATFGGSLVSGGRFFRMAKTCTPKYVKGILF